MLKKIKVKLALIIMSCFWVVGVFIAPPTFASEPFLGEIMMFGFNFTPRGWAACDGQILPINQNQSLYSLLGTTYGGDGRTSFALPDLRGRMAMHRSDPHPMGQKSGQERVALTIAQMPSHTHDLMGRDNALGATDVPGGNSLAYDNRDEQYSNTAPDVSMDVTAIDLTGGGQAHENMPPFLTINHCIALQGLFPSRN